MTANRKPQTANRKPQNYTIVVAIIIGSLLGVPVGFFANSYIGKVPRLIASVWDDPTKGVWEKEFLEVEIDGSTGEPQKAYFLSAPADIPKPLLISLHTWSGDYKQFDPLASMAVADGWNYIHPDYGGKNNNPDACLSEKSLQELDDAIDYAIANGNVDPERIFVSGVSGGGYAALGFYLRTKHKINTVMSWVPISDLSSWYYQSRARKLRYANDIERCTSSNNSFNIPEAINRSPLHWNQTQLGKSNIEIYAGIDDGHDGSVPISHSILFFNKIARISGFPDKQVGIEDFSNLITRGIKVSDDLGSIGDRRIVYTRNAGVASLVVFEGGHEMLTNYAINRLRYLASETLSD